MPLQNANRRSLTFTKIGWKLRKANNVPIPKLKVKTSFSNIVNGPYKIKSYSTSERLIFEKNPYYWKKDEHGNQLPYIERVFWGIVESTDTSLIQFRSGSLDSIEVAPQDFSLLKQEEKRGNFTIYNGGTAYGTNYISFNLNKGKREGKPLVDPIKSRWFNSDR